jgi:hypothetical protein
MACDEQSKAAVARQPSYADLQRQEQRRRGGLLYLAVGRFRGSGRGILAPACRAQALKV